MDPKVNLYGKWGKNIKYLPVSTLRQGPMMQLTSEPNEKRSLDAAAAFEYLKP